MTKQGGRQGPKQGPKQRQKLLSLRGDLDPEDEYNTLDNPIIGANRAAKYRKHYDREAGPVTRGNSSLQSAILEESFSKGKYKGERTSREALGLDKDPSSMDEQSADTDEETISDDGEDPEDSPRGTSDATEDLARLKRELAELKTAEARAVQVIHEQKIGDRQRGQQVRNQLLAWELLLDVEMRVHPLLNLVNQQDRPKVSRQTLRELANLGRELQQLAQLEQSESDLASLGREQLARWHAQTVSSSAGSLSSKARLQTFHRDPWTIVEDSWRADRERLLKRARTNRSGPTTAPSGPVYDDADFYRYLLKEWSATRSAVGHYDPHGTFRVVKPDRRPTDNKSSKGRRLAYDPHPKLISYMVPQEDPSGRAWTDAKLDDLIGSLFKY